jgi:AMMECR1 domain-containing protein
MAVKNDTQPNVHNQKGAVFMTIQSTYNPDSSLRNSTAPLKPLKPSQDLLEYAKEYARQKPEVVALWCFGMGFIVGWKLKPW